MLNRHLLKDELKFLIFFSMHCSIVILQRTELDQKWNKAHRAQALIVVFQEGTNHFSSAIIYVLSSCATSQEDATWKNLLHKPALTSIRDETSSS